MRIKDFRDERRNSVARKRAAKSSSGELVTWVDIALTDIAMHMRQDGGIPRAKQSAETLWAILDELDSRNVG